MRARCPTRRASPLVSAQSFMPVTAAPAALTRPSATAASAAVFSLLSAPADASVSNTTAAVHEPTGTSVRTACSGSCSHVPCSALRTAGPRLWRALRTLSWTGASIGSSHCWRSARRASGSLLIEYSDAISRGPTERHSGLLIQPVTTGRRADARCADALRGAVRAW